MTQAEERSAWRVASLGKRNLDLAIAHETWGARRNYLVGRLRLGEKVVLYVSQGSEEEVGYWGVGEVTHELFHSREEIWPSSLFPFRFGFVVPEPLLLEPVPKEVLFEHLPRRGNKRFEYGQPSSVMRLAPHELELIESLIDAQRQRLGAGLPPGVVG